MELSLIGKVLYMSSLIWWQFTSVQASTRNLIISCLIAHGYMDHGVLTQREGTVHIFAYLTMSIGATLYVCKPQKTDDNKLLNSTWVISHGILNQREGALHIIPYW